tara:strand:+ start:1150 stop:2676 length:1527 start_codon:yes stop_codon:yes gene_type:complete
MGAYENPQAVIDTGTPQILANTISNVGKTAAQGLANELKKQQDWLTYTYKFSSQEYDKVEAQLEKNKISTEKSFDLLKPMLDNSIKLQIDALKSRNPEERIKLLKQAQTDKTKIKDFIVIERGLQDADKSYAEALGGNPGLAGKGGGIPLAGEKDRKYNLAMAIRGTFNEGTQEEVYEGEPSELVIKFTSKAIKDAGYENGKIVWNKAELAAYELGTLTDIKASQTNLLLPYSEKNTSGIGILNSNNELSENHYDSENIIRVKTAKGKDGVWYETPIYGISKESKAAYEIALNAKAKSLLANPSQAQRDWENELGFGKGELKYGSDSGNNNIFDAKSNAIFIESFVDRGKKLIEGKEKKGKPVRMTTPPPPKNTGEDGGKDKLVVAKSQEMYNDFASNPLEFLKGSTDFRDLTSGVYEGPTPLGTPPSKVRVEVSPELTKEQKGGPAEAQYRTFDLGNKNDLSALWQYYTKNSNYGQATKDKMLDVGNLNKKENLSVEDLLAKYSTEN